MFQELHAKLFGNYKPKAFEWENFSVPLKRTFWFGSSFLELTSHKRSMGACNSLVGKVLENFVGHGGNSLRLVFVLVFSKQKVEV